MSERVRVALSPFDVFHLAGTQTVLGNRPDIPPTGGEFIDRAGNADSLRVMEGAEVGVPAGFGPRPRAGDSVDTPRVRKG